MPRGAAASRHRFRLVSLASSRGALSCAVPQQRESTPAALTRSQAHPCQPLPYLTATFSYSTALAGLAEWFMACPSGDLGLAAHTARNTQLLPEWGFLVYFFKVICFRPLKKCTYPAQRRNHLYAVPSSLCLTTLNCFLKLREIHLRRGASDRSPDVRSRADLWRMEAL